MPSMVSILLPSASALIKQEQLIHHQAHATRPTISDPQLSLDPVSSNSFLIHYIVSDHRKSILSLLILVET